MRICAWCKKLLSPAKAANQAPQGDVSHGICPSCLAAQLESVRPAA